MALDAGVYVDGIPPRSLLWRPRGLRPDTWLQDSSEGPAATVRETEEGRSGWDRPGIVAPWVEVGRRNAYNLEGRSNDGLGPLLSSGQCHAADGWRWMEMDGLQVLVGCPLGR